MGKLASFYLQEKNVLTRLGVLRLIFSIIIIQFTLSGSEILSFTSYFEQSFFNSPPWYSTVLPQWSITIITLAILNMIGFYQEYVKWALALAFIPFTYYLNYHLDRVSPPIWSYTTNIPILMIALLFSNNEAFSLDSFFRKKNHIKSENIDSFILKFLQIFILSMFFQSAVSKVSISGWNWFLDSKIMHFHIAMQGTDIGKKLLDYDFLIILIAFLTGLFEFLGFLIFLKSKHLYAFVALSFHYGAWLVLDVNFYFLYPPYIALFFNLDWLNQVRNQSISKANKAD